MPSRIFWSSPSTFATCSLEYEVSCSLPLNFSFWSTLVMTRRAARQLSTAFLYTTNNSSSSFNSSAICGKGASRTPLPCEICNVMFKWVCAVLVALKDLKSPRVRWKNDQVCLTSLRTSGATVQWRLKTGWIMRSNARTPLGSSNFVAQSRTFSWP